ncbi:hypothetical protein J6590_022297 [Homalodisca vitripennis]|nr:hypothetical protein J6590_022297 [Homalodisca vitripennis]
MWRWCGAVRASAEVPRALARPDPTMYSLPGLQPHSSYVNCPSVGAEPGQIGRGRKNRTRVNTERAPFSISIIAFRNFVAPRCDGEVPVAGLWRYSDVRYDRAGTSAHSNPGVEGGGYNHPLLVSLPVSTELAPEVGGAVKTVSRCSVQGRVGSDTFGSTRRSLRSNVCNTRLFGHTLDGTFSVSSSVCVEIGYSNEPDLGSNSSPVGGGRPYYLRNYELRGTVTI